MLMTNVCVYANVTVSKECNVEQHFMIVHKDYWVNILTTNYIETNLRI
jgi:hypothetical protein